MPTKQWDWSCLTCQHATIYSDRDSNHAAVECAKSGRTFIYAETHCMSYERRVVRDMPKLYARKMRSVYKGRKLEVLDADN